MGKHFGELAFVRGIVYYKISPHEQKPFARALSFGLFNFIPRIWSDVRYWLPQFVIGYLVYKGCEETHYMNSRKNIHDYDDEIEPGTVE